MIHSHSIRTASNYTGRRFLFLQGLASPFFGKLASHLAKAGAETLRVNFRTGDKLWWQGPSLDFRGRLEELPLFYSALFEQHRFTDVALFGDMRPVHLPVKGVTERHGARLHVFEEGYLRPNWITIERGGVNANSPLPRDAAWYKSASAALPPAPTHHEMHVPIALRASQDLSYRLAGAADPLVFPRYRTHRPRRALAEYTGWARRYAQFPFFARRDKRALHETTRNRRDIFLLPLQLNGDTQITHHSTFRGVSDVIEHVLDSFARHAPPETALVVKNHPLDPGLDRHACTVLEAARRQNVVDRVVFLETTNLAEILPRTRGVVLVNSTTGLSAIWRHIPVFALADPIYNMPGLTHQGDLAGFWNDPQAPDEQLYQAFRHVLLHVNQVNGDFFTRRGIEAAVLNCERMLQPQSPLEELLSRIPPPRETVPASRSGALVG